jgi:ribosomal-protein-alanine N-acetyltransferase
MEILEFLPEYLTQIKEIDRECFLEKGSFSKSYLLFLWKRFPQGFLVAKEGEEILGYGICQKKGEKGIIFSIAVKRKWQNLGIGTKILENLLEILKKEGVKEILLHVRENNQRAISFYKNLGFEIKERVERYYFNGHNAFLMVKTLSNSKGG